MSSVHQLYLFTSAATTNCTGKNPIKNPNREECIAPDCLKDVKHHVFVLMRQPCFNVLTLQPLQ